ncbi:hypothetical protein GQ44DRAFT_743023 [Phaeosphaeriaceae sp. PMI808]|nr:hypothetical protein GQ44DRAFT_743023 [Phaeosphaeriaceae sp. PMI808]
MATATNHLLSGLWQPTHLQQLHYGSNSVQQNLLNCLPTSNSKAFIITGSSLATKTHLIKQTEALLVPKHAPIAQLDSVTEILKQDDSIDTQSPTACTHNLENGYSTTLSAIECTMMAGYTESNGVKTGVRDTHLVPRVVLYDSTFALYTPKHLWLSTGMRAMDHAIELLYHPSATKMPARWSSLQAATSLFENLPRYKKDPRDEDTITKLQLAAFASLGFLGCNIAGGLGLSHGLGYALGSPYDIPHGVTSCLTLGHVVRLKAGDGAAAEQVARLLPFISEAASGNAREDAEKVGRRILQLVKDLGLDSDLRNYRVGRDQIPVITKRTTGQESGDVYDAVESLVKGLFV